MLNGVFGSAAAAAAAAAAHFVLPQSSPEAFLAWTYAAKSPVIKQLEGPL